MERRVAIIGLDGISWPILDKFFNVGAMPFLKHLSEKSLKGVIESTKPPWTPPAWTSIATGVNPGKHGIFSFYIVTKRLNEFHARFATAFDIMYPRIHEILDYWGLKSIIVNLPLTYPASFTTAKNVVIVSDWFAPRLSIYPKYFEKFRHFFNIDEKITEDKVRLFLDGILELANYDHNLLFTVISQTDWLMHKEGKRILNGDVPQHALNLMRIIDSFIKKVYNLVDHLIIVSDHGFDICHEVINLREFLINSGVKCKKLGEATVTFKIPLKGTFQIPNVLLKILRHSKVRNYMQRLFKKTNIGSSQAFLALEYKDCEALLTDPGYVYLAPGREREVINIIRNCETLTLYDPNEIYSGPYLRRGPDIVVEAKVGFSLDSVLTHSQLGIIMVTNVDKSNSYIKLNTWDVVPLTFYLFGIPMPLDTDGNIRSLSKMLGVQVKDRRNYTDQWRIAKKIKERTLTR